VCDEQYCNYVDSRLEELGEKLHRIEDYIRGIERQHNDETYDLRCDLDKVVSDIRDIEGRIRYV